MSAHDTPLPVTAPGRNWAGNHVYSAATLHHPRTIDELRRVVAGAARIRVLGSRHSFSDIADSADLVSTAGLPPDIVVDHTSATVSLNPAVTYGELAAVLAAERVALHNLASLPHISVGGAVATATHGSGDGNGNLATAVAALQLVTSAGEIVTARRGDPDFGGMVVSLGALGAVTRLTLDVQPAYEVRQNVYVGMTWEALLDNFDAVFASGYSVSAFTHWTGRVEQVWVKSRVGATDDGVGHTRAPAVLFGAAAATYELHPVPGMSAANCTPQRNVIGSWADRLPHFRMGFMPSAGDEIQSEFFVPRRYAVAAIEALRARADAIAPHLLVSEIRTIAADSLWMSPQCGADVAAIHFTWKPDAEAVGRALVHVEDALAAFGARPHWGKVFRAEALTLAPLYERHSDFVALAQRLDGRGAFRNEWLERRVLG